ncbi:hypothetical protein BJV77DRAFT_1015702, partial [Russula vinacea]
MQDPLLSPPSCWATIGPLCSCNTQRDSSATSPASQDELSWLFKAGQFTPATSSSPTGGGNEEGPVAPEYGTSFYGAT